MVLFSGEALCFSDSAESHEVQQLGRYSLARRHHEHLLEPIRTHFQACICKASLAASLRQLLHHYCERLSMQHLCAELFHLLLLWQLSFGLVRQQTRCRYAWHCADQFMPDFDILQRAYVPGAMLANC